MAYWIENVLEYFFPKNALKEFEEKVQMNNNSMQKFLTQSVLLGFGASIASIAILFSQKQPILYITIVSISAFFLPLLFNFLLQEYIFERNKGKKEENVPDLLLQASVFPRGSAFTEIIDYAAKADFGLLGEEFKKIKQEIETGASVETALKNMGQRNKSRVIERAANLLIQGYKSGADMKEIFREAAADLLETNAILKERNAALVVEKYTLLLGGGLIVPAVLGLIAGLVTGFNLSSFNLIEFGVPLNERKEILSAVLFANKVYIAEYALIASYFIASQEGQSKKAVLYASFLLPVSLLTYFAARAFSF